MSTVEVVQGIALLVSCFALGVQIAVARRARRELDAARRDKAKAVEIAVKERADAMRLQVQLAGCGVAALGGLGEQHLAKKGQYGWSASYQDVVDARLELEALRAARDQALHLLRTEPTSLLAEEVLEASKEAAALMRPDRTT